jgi:hypothetical protein
MIDQHLGLNLQSARGRSPQADTNSGIHIFFIAFSLNVRLFACAWQ